MTPMTMTRRLSPVLLALALAGCPPTPPAGDDGGQDAGCAGQVGCECNAGVCTSGECLDGTCVDCRRGEAACSCRANNTCNTGLRCATGRCESCPAGELSCPCGAGDTCGAGLVCTNGTCVTDTCTAGADGCPCRAGDPKCDSALYCDPGTTVCRACSNDVVGCPCVGGACTGQTVCDTGTSLCRAPVTCAQLRAANQCQANQQCVEATNVDATCTPMTCEAGYKWNGAGCTQCVDPSCANEPSCDPGTDAGVLLLADCAAKNRACTTVGAVSACGACLAGFAQDPATPAGACRPVPRCGTATCALNQYCETNGTAPTCTDLPCPDRQAKNSNGVCTPCSKTCSGAGFSGRVWPYMTTFDVCVCETLDGYFIETGGSTAASVCDADRDGWVNKKAVATSVTSDRALRPNARCSVRETSRVRLWDETGLSVDIMSCTEGLKKASTATADGGLPNGGLPLDADGGLVPQADGGVAGCTGLVSIVLVEPESLEVPRDPLSSTYGNYQYGANGRQLDPAELNPLTKFCVLDSTDFNGDGKEDIAEVQKLSPSTNDERLGAFAYFAELYTSSWEGGVLHVREKSRCLDSFPVHYATDGGAESYNFTRTLPAGDTPYWRACGRQRDPQFTTAQEKATFDFAQYACNAPADNCVERSFDPVHPVLPGWYDRARYLMRDHGLCRLGGQLPADGLWRGMNHHSQFKCVKVVTTANPSDPTRAFEREQAAFGGNTLEKLTLNECEAVACPTSADGGVAFDASCSTPGSGGGLQNRQPVIRCTAKATADLNKVGLAAVNYVPYRAVDSQLPTPGGIYNRVVYGGGCVNEDDQPSAYLCHFPEYSLTKSEADEHWGRYSCYGDLQNFLWARDRDSDYVNSVVPISTLYWAPTTGLPDGGSVLR